MIVNLRAKHDLVDISQSVPAANFTTHYSSMAALEDPFMQLASSVDNSDYLGGPGPHGYSKEQVFTYNYLIWTLAFFLCLQFTHADEGIMKQFVLDPAVMKNWPPVLWAVFAGLVSFLGALVVIIVKLYLALSIVKWYICFIGAVGVWFYLKARKATDIHIHHYCIGAAVVSICCYQDIFITLVSGIFNGIMIEGASRWGYDPVFTYPSERLADGNDSEAGPAQLTEGTE
jgi:hypothetical protein